MKSVLNRRPLAGVSGFSRARFGREQCEATTIVQLELTELVHIRAFSDEEENQ